MTTETVRKTHQLYDEREQVWFDVYEAPGIEGRPITAEVPFTYCSAEMPVLPLVSPPV